MDMNLGGHNERRKAGYCLSTSLYYVKIDSKARVACAMKSCRYDHVSGTECHALCSVDFMATNFKLKC